MAYYYYQSLRKTIIQFLDVFNSVQIARHNSSGVVTGYKKVPLKFGTKEKTFYWLHERKDEEMLPIISVVLNSVEYSAERQTSKIRSVVKSQAYSDGDIDKFLNPVPYNLGFTTTIWSLHMVDVDQILEQILPYFTPNIFIRVNIPELDASLDMKVIFLTCAPDTSLEMADEEARLIKWNIDFIVHSYLFQPLKSSKLIKKVIQKIYTEDEGWSHRFTESAFTSGAGSNDYENVALYTKAKYPYFDEPDWAASTSYEVGDLAKPTTANGFLYEVQRITIPGVSGITEPTWTTTKNTPIVDNDVIWERYEHDDYLRLVELERFGD
jgi:hypothetical protein